MQLNERHKFGNVYAFRKVLSDYCHAMRFFETLQLKNKKRGVIVKHTCEGCF